ncbi:MAG: hypothetical protein A2Y97_06255 [Nitrospirae bacterium RBG_13_39_12]|nr:MAG: hypothetical protein A2Y97_06255 [Nitrospirae bacterium RBG_13_39_12]
MDKKRLIISIVFIFMTLSAIFAGCATTSDLMKDKDKGTAKIYPVNTEKAWEIAKDVFLWEGIDELEEHRDKGYMLTGGVISSASPVAVMGAWIEPVDENNTKVTFFTKRRSETNSAATSIETTFHERFAEAVDAIKKRDHLHLKYSE